MSDEKLRIMQMIKDGKITPEEAVELLEALESPRTDVVKKPQETYKIVAKLDDGQCCRDDVGFSPGVEEECECCSDEEPSTGKKPRWLYVQVREEDGKNVNIKIPISLAKFVNKFIPNEARKEMKDQGIDLDLGGLMDELQKHGEMDLVNIDEGDGKTVRIFTK
jgi:DUF4097 and DUF4098 domain-containing protein YvlB